MADAPALGMTASGVTAGRAIVLGGGIAGISAALRLQREGRAVTLLEAHRWLGGRVFSVPDARLGGARDNGPHVLLGCYDEFRALLRVLGTEHSFARAPALAVAYANPRGERSELRLPRWPVPLALPWALLRLPALSLSAKLRTLLGCAGVLLGAPASASLEDWLRRYRQHDGPRRYFWDPLCLAVMNAAPAQVSARLFLRTMRRAFRGSAARGAIWVPPAPWSAIVGEPALRLLRARGVSVRLGVRVRELVAGDGRIAAIALDDGEAIAVDADTTVVATLPWHALASCLPAGDDVGARARAFAGRPIVAVYFALPAPAPLPQAPLVALVDGDPFHFLVRRPSDDSSRFALLAGGTDRIAAMSAGELAAAACAQLARHFPGAVARPEQTRVVKEARATLDAHPAAHAARPACGLHPRWRNLLLAGDWCATELPSTMEGAAASAELALAAWRQSRGEVQARSDGVTGWPRPDTALARGSATKNGG